MADKLSLKGDRKFWTKFVNKVRAERKTVWQVLEPMLKCYLKGRKK